MNTFYKILRVIVWIVAIGGVFYFVKDCSNPPEPVTEIVHTRDTVFVTKQVEVPKYIPKWKTKIEYKDKEIPVPVDVDTTEILKEFFSEFVYNDTLRLDSLGYGIVTDTVTENKIKSRSILWDYKIPVIYDSTTIKIYPLTRKFFVGGGIGMNKNELFNAAEIGVLYKDRRDRIFGLHTGLLSVDGKGSGYIKASVYFKLGKK